MAERRATPDLDPLDGLLSALGEGVAHRVQARTVAYARALTQPEAVGEAFLRPAPPVGVASLPRGVSRQVVFRGVFQHFLPGAAAVVLPLFTLMLLLNPFDWITNVPVPLGVLGSTTVGFGVGLGALSRWLFPHSNPDGHRSDVAGMVSPFLTLTAALGLSPLLGPLSTVHEFIAIWAVAAASGFVMALVTYAPWLRSTPHIASASPAGRWALLRATVSMGVAGSGTFGLAYVALGILEGLRFGSWSVTAWLSQGVLTGFLIGVLFAVVLWRVYRHVSVDQLNAVRVGAWGALAAALPGVALVTLRTFFWGVSPQFSHPTVELVRLLFAFCLPGFLLAYGAVRLAQASSNALELAPNRVGGDMSP